MPRGFPDRIRLAGREFPLSGRAMDVAGTRFTLAEVPYTSGHLDQVVGALGLRERDWPYWLEDWPATYALAELLAQEPPSAFAGGILDLGCGSGVLAAFLAARFGVRVFSCDFNADACRLAALNSTLAALPAGRPSPPSAPAGRAAAPRVFCADFRAFPSRAAFGLVLAGEMLYARENQGPILAFLERHLAPSGTAWLADPGRSAAEGFADAAAAAGFAAEVRRAPSRAAGRNVDVYRLAREIPTLGPLG